MTPVPLPGINNVRQFLHSGRGGLLLKTDGSVWAWGQNSNNDVGVADSSTAILNPARVMLFHNVIRIVVGDGVPFAVLEDGRVLGWGGTGSLVPRHRSELDYFPYLITEQTNARYVLY